MQKYQFTTATVYVEDDLVISVNDGPVNLEMLTGFLALAVTVRQRYGYVLLLVDATRYYPVTKEARRYLADWSVQHKFDATAVFGAGPIMRAAIGLASRAMTLLGKEDTNTAYFATEAEGRDWLKKERQRFLVQLPARTQK